MKPHLKRIIDTILHGCLFARENDYHYILALFGIMSLHEIGPELEAKL